MIAEVNYKNQKKKRDAAYYREYRLRKKYGTDNILQFPAAYSKGKLDPFPIAVPSRGSLDRNPSYHSKNIAIGVFVLLLTGMLIHLSAPFYMQGHSKPMAYLMASLVEMSILFLLSMPTTDSISKITKYVLIIAMSAYALVPIALNPVKETQSKIAQDQNRIEVQTIKIKSIQSEISSRKQKMQLLQERGRITLAQSELQTISTLESELRNIVTLMQPAENQSLELQSSYGVGIQRFLLMLCNLFFVHQLVVQRKFSLRKPKNLVPIFNMVCAT